LRKLLATAPQRARESTAAIVRAIFAQTGSRDARAPLAQSGGTGCAACLRAPRSLLEHVAEDVLAYGLFRNEHRRKLHSTNVLVS
jgi:hypothetical protein